MHGSSSSRGCQQCERRGTWTSSAGWRRVAEAGLSHSRLFSQTLAVDQWAVNMWAEGERVFNRFTS